MKKILAFIPLIILAGCTAPHIDIPMITPAPASTPAPVSAKNTIAAPEAMTVTAFAMPSGGKATANVVWNAATGWNKQLSYFVGYGLSTNNYTVFTNTTFTSCRVTGLKPQTVYYFSVKTVDSTGLQSQWAKWYHYLTPKQNTPFISKPAIQ